MKEITHGALYDIVKCVYMKKITLNTDTVDEVLIAADMLQMTKIVDECKKFMVGNISKENCFEWIELFERYGIVEGKYTANTFILKNIINMSNTPAFLAISKTMLCSFLADRGLNVKDEIDVFRSGKNWLDHDKDRLQYAEEIMKCVALARIPSDLLTNEVGNVEFMIKDEGCRKLLFEAFGFMGNVYTQPLCKGTIDRPRGKYMLVYVEEGKSMTRLGEELLRTRGESTTITYAPLVHASSGIVDDINIEVPFVKWSVSLVTCGNFLFLFAVDSKTLAPVAKRFDGNTQNWIDLKPYHGTPKVGLAASLVGEVIVLAGGMKFEKTDLAEYKGEKIINETMVYDIRKNSWKSVGNLPEPFADAKACSRGDVMFIAQGIPSSGSRCSKVLAYDAKADKWTTKPKLMIKKLLAGIAWLTDDNLIAVHYSSEVPPSSPIRIEIFSIGTNQWSVVNGPLMKACDRNIQSFLVPPVFNDRLYFIAGPQGGSLSGFTVRADGYVMPRTSIYSATRKYLPTLFGMCCACFP